MISPDCLLERRRGNCFEMATLLCSLLVGHGFDALVVSGYASREITRNNQSRVVCPAIAEKCENRGEGEDDSYRESGDLVIFEESKYRLKDPIDLNSKFMKQLRDEEAERIAAEKLKAAEEEAERIRHLEALPVDELQNRRVHSWVLMRRKGNIFFIEPSTGFRYEINDREFIGIESVWNHENYMVNKQEVIVDSIGQLQWNLLDRTNWERLLNVDSDYPDNPHHYCPKYLDMPLSWVNKLTVSAKLFEERFPQQQKVIKYKRTIHEQFAVYKELDGVVERIKTFESLTYQTPVMMWEFFENRADLLDERVTDFEKNEIAESFKKGRQDALKRIRKSSVDPNAIFEYEFYNKSRFDCLTRIQKSSKVEIEEFYKKRDDRITYRRFKFSEELNPNDNRERVNALESIEEHFERDPQKPALKDIAVRKFSLLDCTIFLQYHYEDFYITATTREFVKPPKPKYGEEIRFDPNLTKSYKSNPEQPDPSNIELYELLLEQLKDEKLVIEAFASRCKELQQLKVAREKENKRSALTFSVFDSLRNEEARRLRLERLELIALRNEQDRRENADFLGPYLIKHSREFVELCSQIKEGSISFDASKRAFDDCVKDFEDQRASTVSDVERMLDETKVEVEKFKEFITKFKDHFTTANVEQITKEGEGLQRFKHVLQKRLNELKACNERKLKEFRNLVLEDDRLNLEFRNTGGVVEGEEDAN